MRTVDLNNVLREWEFKMRANASSLGQLLRYVALSRRDQNFQRHVVGVLAAFEFAEDVHFTNASMNLGLELVRLPRWLRNGGCVLLPSVTPYHAISIPAR
jgi:RecB family endonuclease NucS